MVTPSWKISLNSAATGNPPDHRAVSIAELQAQFANALHEGIVGNRHIAPNGIVKLPLGDETSGVLGEMAEEKERLRPQLEVTSCDAHTAARQIQLESVEAQDPGNNLIHGAPRMNRYRTGI